MLQPLVYSKFRLVTPGRCGPRRGAARAVPDRRRVQFRIVTLMNEPAVQVVYEDWFKDNDVEWVYWLDAFHIVISGSAEITYWDPPNWEEARTVVARPRLDVPHSARVAGEVACDQRRAVPPRRARHSQRRLHHPGDGDCADVAGRSSAARYGASPQA